MAANRPCCYDCWSEDVTVKVIDPLGFERWFCAADWQAHQEFGAALIRMLRDAAAALAAEQDTPPGR